MHFNNCTEEWALEEAKKVNIIGQFCLKWYHKSVTDSFIPQISCSQVSP